MWKGIRHVHLRTGRQTNEWRRRGALAGRYLRAGDEAGYDVKSRRLDQRESTTERADHGQETGPCSHDSPPDLRLVKHDQEEKVKRRDAA